MKRILALAAFASISISVLSAISGFQAPALALSARDDGGAEYASGSQADASSTYSPEEASLADWPTQEADIAWLVDGLRAGRCRGQRYP